MESKMKKIIYILGLLFSFDVVAANIEAEVNKKNVPLDELFTLTITVDENSDKQPDLRVLKLV